MCKVHHCIHFYCRLKFNDSHNPQSFQVINCLWYLLCMPLLFVTQSCSSILLFHLYRGTFTHTGSATMYGPSSYKMLLSKTRNLKILLEGLRLWLVIPSCSHCECSPSQPSSSTLLCITHERRSWFLLNSGHSDSYRGLITLHDHLTASYYFWA